MMTTTTTPVATAPVAAVELAEAEVAVAPLLPAATTAPLFVLPLPVTEEELVDLPVTAEPVVSDEPPAEKPRLDFVMPPPFVPPPPPPPLPAMKPVVTAPEPEPVKLDSLPLPAPLPVADEIAAPVKAAPPVVVGPVVAGTVSAKQVAPMQTMEKTEKVAERAAQILPRGKFVPVAEPVRAEAPAPVVPRRPIQVEVPAAMPVPVALERPVRLEAPAPVEAVRPPAAVEKVFTEISHQVVLFKRVGAASAEVQVRPDRQTEITLHLSVRAGQVEVTAQVERGDFDGLRAHWAGLQESLAQQGVRVGPLVPTAAALDERFAGGQAGMQFRDQSFRPFERETFEEPRAGAASVTPAPTRRAATPSGRGWERWA